QQPTAFDLDPRVFAWRDSGVSSIAAHTTASYADWPSFARPHLPRTRSKLGLSLALSPRHLLNMPDRLGGITVSICGSMSRRHVFPTWRLHQRPGAARSGSFRCDRERCRGSYGECAGLP